MSRRPSPRGGAVYYYLRGGPRLSGEPGSPEFVASYNEAIAERRAPDSGRFRYVVADYKGSPGKLAESTRSEWGKWLDRIAEYFGDLSIQQFSRPEKIRPIIRRWRNQWAGLQVLSRVLAHAVDPMGKIASNPAEGIKRICSTDRSDIIWTDADVEQVKKTCSPEIANAVDLAGHTGLLSDLLRLSWTHVGEDAIILATGKSKAVIPLYKALAAASRDVAA